MAEEIQRQLQILKVYVKDCSVECPNSPNIFNEQGNTQFNLNVDVGSNVIQPDVHEVVLTMSATASIGDRTLFLIEVQQAGLFAVQGFPEDELDKLLGVWAPMQMYPFAREIVGTLSAHAGFPQVMLPFINFEQLYEQRKTNTSVDGQGATH